MYKILDLLILHNNNVGNFLQAEKTHSVNGNTALHKLLNIKTSNKLFGIDKINTTLKLLVQYPHGTELITVPDNNGETPLSLAKKYDYTETFELLSNALLENQYLGDYIENNCFE